MKYALMLIVCTGAWAEQPTVGLLDQLLAQDSKSLATEARSKGDARRGAIVFYQPGAACTTCHTSSKSGRQLGPDLARIGKVADEYLVDAVLRPSKNIRKRFETVQILTKGEETVSGFVAEDKLDAVVLRDASQSGKLITVLKKEIEARKDGGPSLMPAGLVNNLATRQQFLDLVNYLIEIAHAGPTHADALIPDPSLYTARPLPEYEKSIDHAGMIRSLDDAAFKRGESIYDRVCVNCHGTAEQPGSLPTSLKFAKDKFKNGNDPFTMYQTLTHGFGMMQPQPWMVPQEKYDVVHFIRETYLSKHNSSQYFKTDEAYLSGLPKGDSRGPEPVKNKQWIEMDYGPHLMGTWEVSPRDGSNISYKSIAVRLDPGPGGISRGRVFQTFDQDTLRMAAGWNGDFIDWRGINFDGRHAIHPRIGATPDFANPVGPGWAHPKTGSWEDPRLRGRDDKPYGPLPRDWAHYKGLYLHGQKIVIHYTVGETHVMEMPDYVATDAGPSYSRTFNIGPRKKDMLLQVARHPAGEAAAMNVRGSAVVFGPSLEPPAVAKPEMKWSGFNGQTYLEVSKAKAFRMFDGDYTIFARVKTTKGGTILCKTGPQMNWSRDGKSLFIRGGRLNFDVGWVGAASGKTNVADGKEHDVAMTWEQEAATVKLYVDGKLDGEKPLGPRAKHDNEIIRIGLTGVNFPRGQTYFIGEMPEVRFYSKLFSTDEIASLSERSEKDSLVAHWQLDKVEGELAADASGNGHTATVKAGEAPAAQIKVEVALVGGFTGQTNGMEWQHERGDLRLKIPAGDEAIKWTLWLAQSESDAGTVTVLSQTVVEQPEIDLVKFTRGGPKRWEGQIKTRALLGKPDGAFAVDVLQHPSKNPWFCRTRLTGFDFINPDQAVVSAWDGSIWQVDGLDGLNEVESGEAELVWTRSASGLFQPLGVKVFDGKVFVTCRDQLAIIHDLNGDGEIDHIESFNNDHQVTEHFHEFAMGLQVDEEGNFYYAKSARHARTALVPHHGTLLRVSKDGLKTDIIAKGFRAANGVCLNPDGTFIVTDQEGHWNPKNRINWIELGEKFYGNMYGYHDVTDSSDAAMEPPLCWITNRFDRSPSELLWVKSEKWGQLNGRLLNLSYGNGKVFIVPHEKVNGRTQGGMCAFPFPGFPTGVMRGRFHPKDRQLYVAGMFAWAGSAHQPGGLYRIRYTGQPSHLPIELNALTTGMKIKFDGALESAEASKPENYAIKVWDLKRTSSYGSRHYNEKTLKVESVAVSGDGSTVTLTIPWIAKTWCMEIRCKLETSDGKPIERIIHNTIHELGK